MLQAPAWVAGNSLCCLTVSKLLLEIGSAVSFHLLRCNTKAKSPPILTITFLWLYLIKSWGCAGGRPRHSFSLLRNISWLVRRMKLLTLYGFLFVCLLCLSVFAAEGTVYKVFLKSFLFSCSFPFWYKIRIYYTKGNEQSLTMKRSIGLRKVLKLQIVVAYQCFGLYSSVSSIIACSMAWLILP